MTISNVSALFLSRKKSDGGTYQGREFDAYDRIRFIVEGEDNTRNYYVNENTSASLQSAIQKLSAQPWGAKFSFNGEISGNGKIEITEIFVEEDDDFFQ